MSNHPNLTDDDIELLRGIPMLAGSMVVTLGQPGLIEAGREMLAAARVVAEASTRFPGSALVEFLHTDLHRDQQTVVGGGKVGGSQETTAKTRTTDPMVAMAAFVEQLDRALNVLDAKVDRGDADGYKRWIMACAEASAAAAKEGGVLGIGGKRVSDEEAAYLAHLRNRLGLM